MNALEVRLTIPDIFLIKQQALQEIAELQAIQNRESVLKRIGAYEPWRIDIQFGTYAKRREEIYVDRCCWRHLVRMFNLEKYMLCTEYKKMLEDIDNDNTPIFTIENAEGWVAGLKETIYENVRLLCKRVYDNLISGTYRTGGSYCTSKKKKRNNNGIDSFFILSTGDYSRVFGYYDRPTITDDLEKACYLLDGKLVPEVTMIQRARSDKASEVSNEYFSVRMCANGNTHFRIAEGTANKLNRICPDGTLIGEKMRIKIFD